MTQIKLEDTLKHLKFMSEVNPDKETKINMKKKLIAKIGKQEKAK